MVYPLSQKKNIIIIYLYFNYKIIFFNYNFKFYNKNRP